MCHVDIMSIKDYKNIRLNREEARKLVVKLAADGRVLISSHASKRLSQRKVIFNDVMNVLLSQSMTIADGEPSLGGYTYRCSTKRFIVVISFTVSGDGLVVVTVMKTERKT